MPALSSTRHVSIEEAIRFGWTKTLDNAGLFIPLTLLVIVIYFFFSTNFSFHFSGQTSQLHPLSTLLQYVFDAAVGLGFAAISLKVIDQKKPVWNDLLVSDQYILRYLGATIIYTIITVAGTILFIIPGVYLSLKYGLFRYFILDKNVGIGESFHLSGQATSGIKLTLIAFYFILGLINVIGFLCLGIGLLITIPLTILAEVHVYRQLVAQMDTPNMPEQSTSVA